jgi:predicted secreted Zn-dependent protease
MKRLLFFLMLTAIPSAVSSQSLEKYYVSGQSTRELAASIRQLGPRDATGSTKVGFRYSYSRIRFKGLSRAVEPVVERNLTFRMPFWSGYHSASPCLQKSWSAMYASLSRHEIKHAKISDGYVEKIKAAILSVPPKTTNGALEYAVKQAVKKVLRDHSAAQAKFDRDTKHGAADPNDPILFKNCG